MFHMMTPIKKPVAVALDGVEQVRKEVGNENVAQTDRQADGEREPFFPGPTEAGQYFDSRGDDLRGERSLVVGTRASPSARVRLTWAKRKVVAPPRTLWIDGNRDN
jgi:hypothetical protein